jgi:hypothetical protein
MHITITSKKGKIEVDLFQLLFYSFKLMWKNVIININTLFCSYNHK